EVPTRCPFWFWGLLSLSPEGEENKAPGRWLRARGAERSGRRGALRGAQRPTAVPGALTPRARGHRPRALLGRPPGYRQSTRPFSCELAKLQKRQRGIASRRQESPVADELPVATARNPLSQSWSPPFPEKLMSADPITPLSPSPETPAAPAPASAVRL